MKKVFVLLILTLIGNINKGQTNDNVNLAVNYISNCEVNKKSSLQMEVEENLTNFTQSNKQFIQKKKRKKKKNEVIKGNAQCYKDPRDSDFFMNKYKYKGEIDTIIITRFKIDENGNKKVSGYITYYQIYNNLLGSCIELDLSFGENITETIYTYDNNGRVLSEIFINVDDIYKEILRETHYYYTIQGCDSLIEHKSYLRVEPYTSWTKIEFNGNTRTEIYYDNNGIITKEIFIYNEKGQVIKNIQYLLDKKTMQLNNKPFLISQFYYDDLGNRIKLEHLNEEGKVVEIYVYRYDEYGNRLNEVGSYVRGEENPLEFAHKLLESIEKNEDEMKHEYKYDELGNIVEAKWKYGSEKFFSNMVSIRYVYKND